MDLRKTRKKWFVSRPQEKNGVRKGAWKYEVNEDGDFESIQRLEPETILNKKNRKYEEKIYGFEQES